MYLLLPSLYNEKIGQGTATPQRLLQIPRSLLTVSHKTPTVVLLDTDKQFMNFGYQAEDAYNEIVQDDNKNHAEYYYFRRFKMALHTRSVSLIVNIFVIPDSWLPYSLVFKGTTFLFRHTFQSFENNIALKKMQFWRFDRCLLNSYVLYT